MPCQQPGQSIISRQAKKVGEYHRQNGSTTNIKGETAEGFPLPYIPALLPVWANTVFLRDLPGWWSAQGK